MDRDFEKFKGGPNEAASRRLHVTINRGRRILLNKNTYDQLGKPEAVSLYYSRERDMIGIEPTSPRFNEAFPVIPEGHAWRINSAPFCRHFNISVDRTLKFISPEIIGNELRLRLSETVSVARKPQARKKQQP